MRELAVRWVRGLHGVGDGTVFPLRDESRFLMFAAWFCYPSGKESPLPRGQPLVNDATFDGVLRCLVQVNLVRHQVRIDRQHIHQG